MPFRMDIDVMIAAVEARPCLWNRYHENYKDKNKTIEGWKEVCCLLKADYDQLSDPEKKLFRKEVIKRWNNIRDSFRKYTKQIQKEQRSGITVPTTRRYVYSHQLTFLEKMFESKTNGDHSTNRPPDEDGVTEIQKSAPAPTYRPPKRKKRTDEPEQKMIMPVEENENPHLSFCKSFLPMIQDFNEEETIDFQMGVLNMIRDIKQKRSYAMIPPYSSQRNVTFPVFQHNQHAYSSAFPRFFHSSSQQYAQSQSSTPHRKYVQPKPGAASVGSVSSQCNNRSQIMSSPSSSSIASSTDSHTRELEFT